jgi:hypothetical protein
MPDSTVIISGSSRLNGSASVIANYLKDNYRPKTKREIHGRYQLWCR